MRRTFILSIIIVLVGLLLGSYFYSNKNKGQKEKNSEILHSEIFFTPDEFYLNGVRHLINQSPFSYFADYKKFYPMAEVVEINYLYGSHGSATDSNYYPIWLLADSILYLQDIRFYRDPDELSGDKRYRMLEKKIGRKFVIDSNSLKAETPPNSILGSMRADWVTGVFYIKKALLYQGNKDESIDDWKAAPFQKITFKEGKLISAETVILPVADEGDL